MTFKITDVKTKAVLHEAQTNHGCALRDLLKQWAIDNAILGILIDTNDENTPGTADIDASLTGFNFSSTFSYFYL